MRIAVIASVALLTTTGAFAQDEMARKQAVESLARVALEKAVTGAPYSAETTTESVQVLADGNRIVRKTSGRVYRDNEGRTRREQDGQYVTMARASGQASNVRMTGVSIVDPVEGYSYSLNPDEKIAWRTPIGTAAGLLNKVEAARTEEMRVIQDKLVAERARTGGGGTIADEQKITEAKARSAGGAGRGGVMTLDPASAEVRMRGNAETYRLSATAGPLERKTLEGVLVEGRKTTTVIPAGQIGNEQPITIVSEEWRSPELNVLVMTRHSDPRSGESTYRLANIVRAEPDRSLFMVPPDYEIRETGIRRMLDSAKR